jgi:hypothetical protein
MVLIGASNPVNESLFQHPQKALKLTVSRPVAIIGSDHCPSIKWKMQGNVEITLVGFAATEISRRRVVRFSWC